MHETTLYAPLGIALMEPWRKSRGLDDKPYKARESLSCRKRSSSFLALDDCSATSTPECVITPFHLNSGCSVMYEELLGPSKKEMLEPVQPCEKMREASWESASWQTFPCSNSSVSSARGASAHLPLTFASQSSVPRTCPRQVTGGAPPVHHCNCNVGVQQQLYVHWSQSRATLPTCVFCERGPVAVAGEAEQLSWEGDCVQYQPASKRQRVCMSVAGEQNFAGPSTSSRALECDFLNTWKHCAMNGQAMSTNITGRPSQFARGNFHNDWDRIVLGENNYRQYVVPTTRAATIAKPADQCRVGGLCAGLSTGRKVIAADGSLGAVSGLVGGWWNVLGVGMQLPVRTDLCGKDQNKHKCMIENAASTTQRCHLIRALPKSGDDSCRGLPYARVDGPPQGKAHCSTRLSLCSPLCESGVMSEFASSLSISSSSTVPLALHLLARVESSMNLVALSAAGVPDPTKCLVLVCLWISAKLEENRKRVPGSSRVGALIGVSAGNMNFVETHIMGLLDWSPYEGWLPLRSSMRGEW